MAFKEEIQHRGFNSTEQFLNKISQLKLKLKIKQDDESENLTSSQMIEIKYNLIAIEDQFLTPE